MLGKSSNYFKFAFSKFAIQTSDFKEQPTMLWHVAARLQRSWPTRSLQWHLSVFTQTSPIPWRLLILSHLQQSPKPTWGSTEHIGAYLQNTAPKIQNRWEETTCQDHYFSAATQSPVGEVPEFAFSRFANPGPQELAKKNAKISPQTRSVSQQRCLGTLVPDLVAAKVNPFGGAAFQSLRQDLRQLPPTCPDGYAEDPSTGCRFQISRCVQQKLRVRRKPLNIALRSTRSMLKIPALGTYTNMCIGVLKSSHSRSIFLDGTFGPRLEQLALVGHERPTLWAPISLLRDLSAQHSWCQHTSLFVRSEDQKPITVHHTCSMLLTGMWSQ